MLKTWRDYIAILITFFQQAFGQASGGGFP